jgi:hypothetical protein
MNRFLWVLFLVGCGGGFVHPDASTRTAFYTSGCLTFESEVPLNQLYLDWDVSVTKDVMSRTLGLQPGQFCELFGSWKFYVTAEFSWVNSGGTAVGEAWWDGQIELNYTGWSLPHELFHAWEMTNRVNTTSSHLHWDTNGYYAASDEATARFYNISYAGQWPKPTP